MPAGYSSTPLYKKLGIRNGSAMLLLHAPDNYDQLIGGEVKWREVKKGEQADIIHIFATSHQQFLDEMKRIKPLIHPKVVIWVSWYKQAAKMATDLNEDLIRNFALQNDLVDVKVCAVTDIWSGLKLIVPVDKR